MPYAAPELQARAAHGCAADCWSAGVLLREALTGAAPCAETPRDARSAGSAAAAAAARMETESVAAAAAPLL